MNRKLRALLEELKTTRPNSSRIFLNSHGEAYKLVTTVFNDAVRRVDIENFHFHDLRHTFASRLVMAGVDLRTIQALMGHKTINMTLRYAHLAPDHLKRAVEVLDNEKSHNNFHNTPHLPKTPKRSKLLKSQAGRRKVPGGAAGLQNWQARLKKVESERGLSNKSPFMFVYLFVSDSFTFRRYRLIKAHFW